MDLIFALNAAQTGNAQPLTSDSSGGYCKGFALNLASIPRKKILRAARYTARAMTTVPEGKMIDEESFIVYQNGNIEYDLVDLDEEILPGESEPMTTAKTVAHVSWYLLHKWQTAMCFTHRKDMDVVVFSGRDLDAMLDIVIKGDQAEVLSAINGIGKAKIGELDRRF
ncbi:hypothetical protein COCHEDRAFT_1034498 [Bipolaris maydis C5]|uniref:Uncharacterized protein n=1 Tax=Cochliobolus heterostrophus (strain C5 / ATCC 48332 / race O) TaxID=701091 RepID=M2TJS0_COCH5|nr:hypothetical protein COCHEDRAFT_1034498 [Bipolaris maydis C5]KAJ5047750.1 hypothetical protein J3E74DRAFT_296018 [Bipolaris maydis]KAJ5052545.1 hypothetical protein J3E74DRAFT_295638 [Bipolaris maydis]KAJ6203692.1 hypothetical protein PSV09DRAFT_1034498 [Bipolaris maydis]KAJ6267360.1 hypothetical protein PSV08DRAFT_250532 [Bipolaris maydis]